MKTKVLLVENIHAIAKQKLESEGFTVDSLSYAPAEEELLKLLKNYQGLGLRSKTQVTKKILLENPHLSFLGAFCIGTNQIDTEQAMLLGIPVFNAPHSNTRSVAELVIAQMIALSRQLFDRSQKAHQGEWQKTADGSKEVRGKTLGIIGYGHIGSQLSILAEALGLNVLFFDIVKKLPLGNARMMARLSDLLAASDFVSLHVPETPQTKNMIGVSEISRMRKGAYLVNASRGHVVDIDALVRAMKNRDISGCAIDVFPIEPASNKDKFLSPLQGLDNVILTPHIGGSTEEAQSAIGLEVAESFRKFMQTGATAGAVNFPQMNLHDPEKVSRILNVHRNEPGVLGEINGIVSKDGANIQAQSLSTGGEIGYLTMDIEASQVDQLAEKIQNSPRSIRTRVINSSKEVHE
jgi:D-3-phosphoglycerate dehydrogenase / 2-oxoglutarate reductase